MLEIKNLLIISWFKLRSVIVLFVHKSTAYLHLMFDLLCECVFSQPATSNLNGPLSKAVERSMRMISCTAEGIHYWINSIGESNRLIFELFGETSSCYWLDSGTKKFLL